MTAKKNPETKPAEVVEEVVSSRSLLDKAAILNQVGGDDIHDSIMFFAEVNSENAQKFISRLQVLSAILDADDPITVYINTPGGSATATCAMIDAIKRCPQPVVTVATGICASAGVFLLAAGDVRLATKLSTIFYHEAIIDQTARSPHELESSQQFYTMLRTRLIDGILFDACKKSLKTRKSFDKVFLNNTSFYMTPERALELGLIHEVI